MTLWPAKPVEDPVANPAGPEFPVAGSVPERALGLAGLEPGDFVYLAVLLAAGIWIWLRDTAWLAASGETLPILAALPLFIWLGAPWRFREGPCSLPHVPLAVVVVLATVGWALDVTLLLAMAWTFALWIWIKARVAGEVILRRRLAMLPLLAFPWVALDLAPVGWWFRLSAAWVVDHAYGILGFSVVREGTILLISGIPIEVAAPCSGMNSLQAILLGGLVLAWLEFGRSRFFWSLVASLPLLAWVANTARVCSIVAMAVRLGPDAARGSLHQIGGWVVVLLVTGGWLLTARWIAGARPSKPVARL